MNFDFGCGFGCGVAVALLFANWLASKDHRETMAILNHHNEWLRKRIGRDDAADWWKGDEGEEPS